MKTPENPKKSAAKSIRPANAAYVRKTLKIKKLTKLRFPGLQPKYRPPDEGEVYNEYEDTTDPLVQGDVLDDGDQILADSSSLDCVVVETLDDQGVTADVITYNETQDYIEVDMTYFESFEEFYDEEDNLQYEASDCGFGVGIRG